LAILVGGETTHLLNLADVKYKYPIDLFISAYGDNWLPQEVSNMLEIEFLRQNLPSVMEGRFFFIFFERLDKFLRGVRLSLCKGGVPVVFFHNVVNPERSP